MATIKASGSFRAANRAGRNPAEGSEAGNRRRTGHGNRRGCPDWYGRVRLSKKYHKGAKRVGKDVLAVTNDGGREIIVTKQGVITPMKSSDGVIPNNMTETLMDMAAFWQNPNFPKYTDMFRVKPVDSNGGNISFNSTVNVDVQGDMTKETLPDLQTILKQSSKYTQNEMRKNLKRFG